MVEWTWKPALRPVFILYIYICVNWRKKLFWKEYLVLTENWNREREFYFITNGVWLLFSQTVLVSVCELLKDSFKSRIYRTETQRGLVFTSCISTIMLVRLALRMIIFKSTIYLWSTSLKGTGFTSRYFARIDLTETQNGSTLPPVFISKHYVRLRWNECKCEHFLVECWFAWKRKDQEEIMLNSYQVRRICLGNPILLLLLGFFFPWPPQKRTFSPHVWWRLLMTKLGLTFWQS